MEISVEHLTKRYGPQLAVNDVSFKAAGGEIAGFLGPNGAGKSTTLKIITCFLPPTSGTARLDGYDVRTHSLEIRRRIGYLPEHNPLYLEMYARELLRFTAAIFGLTGKKARDRIDEVIGMTGLAPEQHKKIGALSKGYRKRVGLAQALLHDPEVLILDEPTDGLDPVQVVEIRELIKRLGQTKTILFSSHIMSEVEAIAQRVVLINKGKLAADAPVAELRAKTGGEAVIVFEVEKPGFDASALEATTGVRDVAAETETRFVLKADPEADNDARLAVSRAAAAQNNPLLALRREEAGLEDVFRKLAGA